MVKKPNTIGFILYEGPSHIGGGDVVVIATLKTRNRKTGPMIQTWILPRDRNPLSAVQDGKNAMACGNCPLQGIPDKTKTARRGVRITKKRVKYRTCYVNLGQAPGRIYKSYKAGRYPTYKRQHHEVMLAGRKIRLGAYGDPAAMPFKLIEYLVSISSGWTGYSHQMFWIDRKVADKLAKYVMVSCHTPAQHAEAKRRGWRSFVAIHDKQKRPQGSVECPAYTHGVQCHDCGLCKGLSVKAKDVYVIAHGKVGLNLPKVQEMQGSML